MKVLVLGHNGMLGRKVVQELDRRGHNVQTLPRSALDARDESMHGLHTAFLNGMIDVVVNCIGIVNSKVRDIETAIRVNSLFPHRVAKLATRYGARLIHISTDCVFSGNGRVHGYTEEDIPDPTDWYGQTKLLGEVDADNHLTIRTSFIGRGSHGLVDWFLAEKGPVEGYAHAFFSGLTTLELARVIAGQVEAPKPAYGLYHVAGPVISKCNLLGYLRNAYDLGTAILPVGEPKIDRVLNPTQFHNRTGYYPPSWPEMINELAKEPV